RVQGCGSVQPSPAESTDTWAAVSGGRGTRFCGKELIMKKINRRSMLRGSATFAAPLLPPGLVTARYTRTRPDRKLRVVAVGGHADDPQSCAGGTLALYAAGGHDVVGLSLAGGPLPGPDANPAVRAVKSRLDCAKMAEILGIRLDCLNYSGSN